MNRRLLAVLCLLVAWCHGVDCFVARGQDGVATPAAATPPTPAAAPATATKVGVVVQVERPSCVMNFAPNPADVTEMFNTGLKALTGQADSASAWKSLGIVPTDVVGIKIDTAGGVGLSTHRELVAAIVEGLVAAGVPGNKIIIWDKFSDHLRLAGWTPVGPGARTPAIVSVVPGAGFDPKVFYVNEILGRLIWGDLQFRGTRPTAADLMNATRRAVQAANPSGGDDDGPGPSPTAPPSPDQTSNKSFYTTLLTQTCTKIINVPVLSDSPATGLSGCLSTLAMGAVDNTRRFSAEPSWGDPAVPEILDKDFMRQKVVLHVLDAFVAQYAGGPKFNPMFTTSIGALYVSQDPVAVDTLVLKRMERWRKDNQIDPLGRQASHVATAASYGLGEGDVKKMKIIKLP